MKAINRFSSRRQHLDHAFLSARLKEASSYKRIAGYFRSSIFELVGEEIAAIPKVQIVCNSELDVADVAVSKHVRETALKERWNEAPSEVEALLHRDRYRRLHQLLTSGHVEIKVGTEGPGLRSRQSGGHRSQRRVKDLLPWLHQRDQECLRPELRDSMGRSLSRGCHVGRGGVRRPLEGCLSAA